MKAYLMFKDKNFIVSKDGMFNYEVTLRDLEIQEVLNIMSIKDEFISAVCKASLANPLFDLDTINYRQEVLRDCIKNTTITRKLYSICEDIENKIKKYLFGLRSTNLRNTYFTSLDYLSWYLEGLKELHDIALKNKNQFSSKGFVDLFNLIEKELSDSYLNEVEKLINELKVRDDILISAHLGKSLISVDYTLRRIPKKFLGLSWIGKPALKIKDDDEPARKDFEHRKDLAINDAAMALSQAAIHLGGFFNMLRTELAFYVGNLNFIDFAKECNMPSTIPTLVLNSNSRSFAGLYDLALLYKKKSGIVSNDCSVIDKNLYIVTGANQGGKTTFLRSFGQAQLMAQAGMMVAAKEYTLPIRNSIFTHFKKEEDKKIKSGKLDEELERMSMIVDHIESPALVLFNESFASTNEREGSQINKDITDALINAGNEVVSVSHLYTYTSSYFDNPNVAFLIAERKDDGSRSFKINEGMPKTTAYGFDLYKKVFG